MTDSLPILPDDLPFFTGISPDKRTAMLTCLGARVRTVRKCEFLVLAQDLGIQGPTGYTDTGGSHIAIFRYSESVFF